MQKLLEDKLKHTNNVKALIDFGGDISILNQEEKKDMYRSLLYCDSETRQKYLSLIEDKQTKQEVIRISKIDTIKSKMNNAQSEYLNYGIINIYEGEEIGRTLILAKEVFLPKLDKKGYIDEIIVYQGEKKVYERVMQNVNDIRDMNNIS